ncbi:hypothetical protein PTKIN_Ptkin16aG0064200 [Pterospermum kingtungense]
MSDTTLLDTREVDQLVRTTKRNVVLDQGSIWHRRNAPKVNVTRDEIVGDVSDDDKMEHGEEEDPVCPTIRVPALEKIRLSSCWSSSLIIKLIGHIVGYGFLVWRLKALWQPNADIDVIDVGFDVYVVHFVFKEDYDKALFNGPWVIADHYLVVRRWFYNFELKSFSVSSLAVLVRFLSLPLEHYVEEFLLKIGRRNGKPLKMDNTTLSALSGRFTRLCEMVDLSKPLLSRFRLWNKVHHIEYEANHLICFK